MILHYAFTQLPGAIVGFAVAAFTPAIGRFLKKYFVKETTALKSDVAKVEKKL